MRLVHQRQHTVAVRQLDQRAQVRADAVISGVVDENGDRVWVCLNGRAHIGSFHAERDAELPVHFRVDINRLGPAQHQRIDRALVDVARQNDLVPRFARGQDHALHAAGRAAHHQKRLRRAESVCGKVLGVFDDRDRVAEIVQRFHGVDVEADAFFAQKLYEFRVAAAALVARHIERDHALAAEFFQRLIDRRFLLTFQIQGVSSFLHTDTKKAVCRYLHTACDKQRGMAPA